MVVIASWNLENLFRPGDESGPTSQSAYEAKLNALAQTIARLVPDVLAVQEVGEPDALAELMKKVGGQWHTELAAPDGRGIRVGVVSRLPLRDAEQIVDFPDRFRAVQVDDDGTTMSSMGRPGLRVRVEPENTAIDVISCHLKSKLLTFPGGRFSPRDEKERARYAAYALNRRAAEAATIRAYSTRLLHDQPQPAALVVAGDLNDDAQAATTQLFHGPPGSEIGTSAFDRPDKGDAQRLWNLAPLIPPQQRFSRIYRGRGELIDHLLVSQVLVTQVRNVHTGDIGITSVTDQPRERRDEPGSDHRPVVARFQLA